MSQLDAPQPIAEPAFTIESLNPERPADKYKVFRRIGKFEKEALDWELTKVAQRELADAGQPVTPLHAENWIIMHSRACPAAKIVVLKCFVKPMTPNSASIEDLYRDDKLTDDFVEGVTSGFTMSSLSMIILQLTAKISHLEEQIANSQPISEEISQSTEERTGPISDTSKPKVDLPESSATE